MLVPVSKHHSVTGFLGKGKRYSYKHNAKMDSTLSLTRHSWYSIQEKPDLQYWTKKPGQVTAQEIPKSSCQT